MNTYTAVDDDLSNSSQPVTISGRRVFCQSLLLGTASTLLTRPIWAEESVRTVSLQSAAKRSNRIDYTGLSYETMQLADPSFFAANNHGLMEMFRFQSLRFFRTSGLPEMQFFPTCSLLSLRTELYAMRCSN
jgi:hypothetical protein